MIRTVVTGELGVVEVVDENGKRMPEYCGPYNEVREHILRDAPEGAEFYDSSPMVKPIKREEW